VIVHQTALEFTDRDENQRYALNLIDRHRKNCLDAPKVRIVFRKTNEDTSQETIFLFHRSEHGTFEEM